MSKDGFALGLTVASIGGCVSTIAHYVDFWVLSYVISVFAAMLCGATFDQK